MGIGKRLKELREQAELTQGELAEKIGVTAAAVGNYERGISFPREEVIYRLFAALQCEPNDLYYGLYDSSGSPWQIHMMKYRALDSHGREIVDACTNIEYGRCSQTNEINSRAEEPGEPYEELLIAARGKGAPDSITVRKRKNAPDILDAPDYKGGRGRR
jgi:transcriptional regulator with XRE-family HTH domain